MVCVTAISMTALFVGKSMGAVEIVTAVISGVFGFMAGLSMKILESD
jgi:hypothetical protein|tara:strand:+ start:585 stop:725 length:141 start_codon:yes stop_codon:yes gene_type:complete